MRRVRLEKTWSADEAAEAAGARRNRVRRVRRLGLAYGWSSVVAVIAVACAAIGRAVRPP